MEVDQVFSDRNWTSSNCLGTESKLRGTQESTWYTENKQNIDQQN